MGNIIPRVMAIHDLSGIGRCSLTVAIPVLSSMGIQVCPMPTAVLSTQTGGFDGFFFYDFTDGMHGIADHWKDLGIHFDCIYSGFLGSVRQIEIVSRIFDDFKTQERQLIVVDPVMGDCGALYRTYTGEMKDRMHLLVRKADIITPNLTEACFLLREPFSDKPLDRLQARAYLKELSEAGPAMVVITGVQLEDGVFCNVGYDRSRDIYWKVPFVRIPAQYPGTGDIFASVLTGGLLKGDSLPVAMDRATQFICMAIHITYGYGTPEREGIMLEEVLGWLNKELSGSTYESL